MINYTRGVRKVIGDRQAPWPVAQEIVDCIRSRESGGIIPVGHDDIKEGEPVHGGSLFF